jgi:hypothetical protein
MRGVRTLGLKKQFPSSNFAVRSSEMTQFHPFLPLHPLLPGTMRGDGTTELKKQGNFFGVPAYGGGR